MRRLSSALALTLAATLLLAGCQSGVPNEDVDGSQTVELPPLSELTPITDPTSWQGPSTAIIGGPTLAPVADNPAQELPSTVISHDSTGDTEVTVTDTSRLLAISLTGTVAELVAAYGMADALVGRDISTEIKGYEDLPVVTHGGHSVDAEAVLALNPSLILTDGTIGPNDVILQLRDAGVQVVTVTRAIDAESTFQAANDIAAALGIAPLAEKLNTELAAAIAEKEAQIAQLAPSDSELKPRIAFLYIRGTAGIFYLFGAGSGMDSIIDSLDAVDVSAEISWQGEKPITDETLITLNPDIIVVMTDGLASAGGIDGLLAAQPSIALTTAGKNRRIIDVADTDLFAGGTRIPDVLDGLARAVYAPDSL